MRNIGKKVIGTEGDLQIGRSKRSITFRLRDFDKDIIS